MGLVMNKFHILAILCFLSSAILMGLGISRGEGTIYWALIIPIFAGSGWLFGLGSLLLFLGIIMLTLAFLSGSYELVGLDFEEPGWNSEYPSHRRPMGDRESTQKTMKRDNSATGGPTQERHRDHAGWQGTKPSIRTGGVIFIGPIPIIWGSDKKIGLVMALVSVVLVVIFLIFTIAWIYS